MKTLTKPQKKILDFISDYQKTESISPSLEEIQKHFKLKSISTAHYYVSVLQKKGYLGRTAGEPRSIEIDVIDSFTAPKFKKEELDSISVPIVGSANCGPAEIFAEENIEAYLKISESRLPKVQGLFVIRAEGDSMNKAKIRGKNILDGDLVLIDGEDRDPINGDYVLSVIDGCANIKKFKIEKKTGQFTLIPETSNPRHKVIYISPDDEFMINGKVIDVIKR